MPSSQPIPHAPAATGQGASRETRGGRSTGTGSGDWRLGSSEEIQNTLLEDSYIDIDMNRARRETNRSTNAPSLLRRTSTQTASQVAPSQASNTPGIQNPGSQVPTTQTSNGSNAPISNQPPIGGNEQSTDTRYSKADMLAAYNSMQKPLDPSDYVLFDREHTNGINGRASWGKSSDNRDNNGAMACWDEEGTNIPISLQAMTEEEKLAFASDVNSPLKPPPQNANKEPTTQGTNGRKTSVSQGQGNQFGHGSPASSRPGARRQQTADSVSGMNSPLSSRFANETSFFSRKLNEQRDTQEERGEEPKSANPFGTLLRSNTAGGTLITGPTSPWGAGPASAVQSPMGNFGNFSVGQIGSSSTTDKRPGYGSMRGESRFAQLMPTSKEDIASKSAEGPWRRRPRTDTDPFGDDSVSGSAAIGGGDDDSPPRSYEQRPTGVGTPIRGNPNEFGNHRDTLQRGQSHQTPQRDEHEPHSPSITNPYRETPEHRQERDDESYDDESLQQSGRPHGLGGIPEHGSNMFGNAHRPFPSAFDDADRSQTSSVVGGSKGFPTPSVVPSLSNLIGGWPTSGHQIGTPDRETRPGFPSAFGSSAFGSMNELNSPSQGPQGGMFGLPSNPNPAGAVGRGSKLGSLFPAAMQAQMHGTENENAGDGGDMRQSSTFGAIGRGVFPPSRDTDSPMRAGRHPFEDLFSDTESSRNRGPFSSGDVQPSQTSTAFPQPSSVQPSYQQVQDESSNNQLPTAQSRQMVMPDRMRWVYLDPQGQVQGPWSGLEMHDWYKASFFTPDLSVRKLEDKEFEPLGQLIRRIGNSREPFLVPQIGVPHGQPSAAPTGTPFTPTATVPGNAVPQGGSVQPPFAASFPSFGTTLTAEQQNNLERRKQEEQYLMARQREFLAQQQVIMRQTQTGGLPSALHHQASAHSLQSQPSFGSMTSPIGMPQQPPMGSGFFGSGIPSQGAGIPNDYFREEELARLSLQERQQSFSSAAGPPQQAHGHQIPAMFPQNSSHQREQNDPQGHRARLLEFEQLREQYDAEEAAQSATNVNSDPIGPPQQAQQQQLPQSDLDSFREQEITTEAKPEVLSLTQQVQKAASAKQSPAQPPLADSPWGQVHAGLPMPFPPPPQSTTPLPAPIPGRGRTNLPEALNMDSRSQSGTPDLSVPSVAPWAKEPADAPKGPSLKEIQEAEAKKVAKADEAQLAARRAAQEVEKKLLASQTIAPAPGLPTSATWGTASPATPTNAPSPWSKPVAPKVSVISSAASKKTLADIQREEELRKQKVAAATTVTAQPSPGSTGGKRYADLAGKPTSGVPAATASAWNTVGAGGKVKVPTGPAAAVPQVRAVSTAAVPSAAVSRVAPRPSPASRSTTTVGQIGVAPATEEFTKWAKAELGRGLNPGMDIDSFVKMLANFPPEVEIIADSIYSSSKLMDGRRFAEEYVRRFRLAEKGIVEPAKTGSAAGFSGDKTSGWSEVAKKGPVKEEPTAGFKVVPNKKKGKK